MGVERSWECKYTLLNKIYILLDSLLKTEQTKRHFPLSGKYWKTYNFQAS